MAKKKDPLIDVMDAEALALLAESKAEGVDLKDRQQVFVACTRYLLARNKLELNDEEADGGIAKFAEALQREREQATTRTRPGRGTAGNPEDGIPTTVSRPIAQSGSNFWRAPGDRDGAGGETPAAVGAARLGGAGADGDDEPETGDDGGTGDLLRAGRLANGMA